MVRLRAGGHPTPKFIVTGSDITHGKPHPEPFLKAAAMVGVPPSECLVVEDTPAGILAGKAAGCRVLALRTTMSESVLEEARPDWIVSNLADVRMEAVTDRGALRFVLKNLRSLN